MMSGLNFDFESAVDRDPMPDWVEVNRDLAAQGWDMTKIKRRETAGSVTAEQEQAKQEDQNDPDKNVS